MGCKPLGVGDYLQAGAAVIPNAEKNIDRLIEALAFEIVRGYLTPKTAPEQAQADSRTEHVLPVQAKAA